MFQYLTHFSVRTPACFPFTQQWPHPALPNAPSLIPGGYFTWERDSHPQAPPEPGRGRGAPPALRSPPHPGASPQPAPTPGTGRNRANEENREPPCQERADFSAGSPRRQARDYFQLKPVNTAASPAPCPRRGVEALPKTGFGAGLRRVGEGPAPPGSDPGGAASTDIIARGR